MMRKEKVYIYRYLYKYTGRISLLYLFKTTTVRRDCIYYNHVHRCEHEIDGFHARYH